MADVAQGPPVNCLVSSAFHRISLNPEYATGLAMVINLLVARAGGNVTLTEAEAREFEAAGARPKLEAYGTAEGDPTTRGWKVTMLAAEEAQSQGLMDVLETVNTLIDTLQRKKGEESHGLDRFDA